MSEVISGLNLSPGQHAIDGTVGGGGHTLAILQATGPGGKLLAFDRDPAALEQARQQLKDYLPRLTFINDSY
ncbi:MAG: 16S rRNA (cytosine(1402)-N(4))-methyltransferase, partial [Candidatus Veblenbacteria bacterium]|nr:16S rRNA (cytosine(1402)-N(4))-methyltransferase [Candidatus Veblenbacteria bacterium]